MARTIMFIHGMFLNPRSWDAWQSFFQRRGFDTFAPPWPLHAGEPRCLREDVPPGLGQLSLDAVTVAMQRAAAHYEDLILIGHSLGGLIVQKLISRGIGSLGVPICSVAPNRMLTSDVGLFNLPDGDEPYALDADGFFENFGNTMARADSDAAFEQFVMPESRNVLRDCLGDAGKIELDGERAPLLFVAAENDAIIPPALCEKNAGAYTDRYHRHDYVEFKGRGHFICGQQGWEEVAATIAQWIERQSSVGMSGRYPVLTGRESTGA